MAFAGLIAAGIVHPIFIRSRKSAARCGAIFIDRAMGVFTNATTEGDTFVLVFDLGALHAPVHGVQVHRQGGGDFPDPVGLGFAPIEGHAKKRATGAATKARMLFQR